MRKYFLILIFFSAIINITNAQNSVPYFTEIKNGTELSSHYDLGSWIIQNLQANKDFRLQITDSNRDIAGNKHIRYKQFYKALPVEGTMINLHCKGNLPHSFNGSFFPNINLDTTIKIKETEALFYAQKAFPSNSIFSWQPNAQPFLEKQGFLASDNIYAVPQSECSIVSITDAENQIQFRHAYVFSICTANPFDFKRVFVDAINGSVLLSKPLLFETDKKGIAHTKYSGIQDVVCDSMDSTKYKLIERDRGCDSIFVLSILEPSPYWLYDDDNIWNNLNPLKDEVATDVHWGLEQTYDFFKSRFARNSYDGKGHSISGIIHAGRKENIAFWNHAYGRVVLGDGDDSVYDAWASIDIIGHEFTHGLVRSTADLYYEKESGALNESYSDIFGKCVEHYAIKDSFSWGLPHKIMLNGHPSLRSFNDPNSRLHPKYYKGKYYNDTTNVDGYGVHTNSSVQNYWFYLLSEGGIGTREADAKPYNVRKIGMDTAAIIAYYTLTNYLTEFSGFKDAATYSIAATRLLFGDTSHLIQEVINAWYAVGVLNSTSISEKKSLTQNELSIYPNPTKGTVVLSRVTKNNQETNFKLFDLTGRVIPVVFSSQNQNEVRADLATLSAGLYFIELIYEDGERQVLQVVKE